MIVNDISEALTYLAETDEDYARASGLAKGLKYKIKVERAQAYLESEGKTEARRDAVSHASRKHIDAINAYQNAETDARIMHAKRMTAQLKIEVWRTENANRRKGNV